MENIHAVPQLFLEMGRFHLSVGRTGKANTGCSIVLVVVARLAIVIGQRYGTIHILESRIPVTASNKEGTVIFLGLTHTRLGKIGITRGCQCSTNVHFE